ncbi:cation:proton antiporter [Marivirga sp. S37H4]|uniref:Cation:proton antiporter n=1 Tax=Marivirga aurantiaca TaxID=2802615 RepID=A0A934X085_9BACT|nr:cation:proton antiporter [Marivirga aurantiaca]MBK6266121.1 cation:proton antiporter [Marivirga aurantiaca]
MESLNYWPLLIILIIAWIVPLVLSWFEITKVPSVIVEIMMGVIIGPFVLNIVWDIPILAFLAETGFLFLIFLAGLEIDVDKILASFPKGKIRRVDLLKNSLLLALFIYFGSLFLSLPFAWLISQFIEVDIVFFALLLPTVALSITAPILKADGEMTRKFGQIMLMEGAIATVMSIIIISVYSGVLKNGFQVELLLFSIIFIAFTVVYILGKKLSKQRRIQTLLYRLEHAASQIRVRGTVALLLLFVVIAHLINTELAMGAFFAGILMSLFVHKERSALLFKLDGMSYGFFIPIFFIMVGVNLNLSALTQFQESIPFVITLLLGFFITQIIPALIMVKVFGLKKALAGGMLLSARMGIAIATAQIGLSLGVIDSAANAGIVIASILASLIAPVGYRFFKDEKEAYYDIYILGGSKTSLLLAERLKMHDISCLSIIQRRDLVPDYDRKNLQFKYVDNITEEVVNSLGLRVADLVIILTESKILNLEITKFIKFKLKHSNIITRRQSADRELLEHSTDIKFIDGDEVMASHVESMIVTPDAISSLSSSFENYRVEEIRITQKELHKKMVKEIAFPPSGSLVIQRRAGEIFIPHGDTKLLLGDFMTVIGNHNALSDFREILDVKD